MRQKNLWKKALEAAYTSMGRVLYQPLGEWIDKSNMDWTAYYDEGSNMVWYNQDGIETAFIVILEHPLTMDTVQISSVLQPKLLLPWVTLTPVTVDKVSDSLIKISLIRKHAAATSQDTAPPRSFTEHMSRLPERNHHLLKQFKFVSGGKWALCDCLLCNRKLQLASDGSLDLHRELTSFGWLLIGNGKCVSPQVGTSQWSPRST